MKRFITPLNLFYSALVCIVANAYILIDFSQWFLLILSVLFLFINLFVGLLTSETKRIRLRLCHHGGVLLGAFAMSLLVSITYHVVLAICTFETDFPLLLHSMIWCFLTSAYIFWNGIICVYCTSKHLGIKWRIIGAICGMVPVLNIITLGIIIDIVMDEIEHELELENIEKNGEEERCKTK